MTFYFDYLCMERFAKEADNLLCVGGAMTFLLKQLAGQLLTCTWSSQNVTVHTGNAVHVCLQAQATLQALWPQ